MLAVAFFALATSREVYLTTSPIGLTWHVALRKAYSIVAFAIVGYAFRRALETSGKRNVALACVVGIALYSAAIEVAQWFHGSNEGFGWNAIDTLCGALGGALAVADRLASRTRGRSDVRG